MMKKNFEMLSGDEVLSILKSDSQNGLSDKEAKKRLEEQGPNRLEEKKGKSPAVKLLLQFNDPLIYILLAASVISLLLKEYTDTVIILLVVLINGIIGYIQEARAEKAIDALKKLSTPKALVKRDGSISEIESYRLVPGDIVVLDAGRYVPADLRLIESSNLKIEESALTGESVPSEKDFSFTADGDIPLGDRVNMAYMSTVVTYGRATGVVTGTGMNTEIGKIAKILEESEEELTPLQKRLADLGKFLGIVTVMICALLFLTAVIQKRNIFDMLLTAISLSVAAIPEGLPAVVTIVLAAGVQRMAKSRTIVRRLPAVETLGAVNIVCTDKTGTLTQNRMTVTQCRIGADLSEPDERTSDTGRDRFFEGFCLCNDASIENGEKLGDPTETALLDLCAFYGYKRPELEGRYPRINEIPFDSSRKMMTTVHDYGERNLSYTKGSLDRILIITERIYDRGEIRPITHEDRERINRAASKMASNALRVLAVCFRESGKEAEEKELVFLGIAGMIDPPRPEAKSAVAACRSAGITTVMITGDHRETAFAIAKELGIADNQDQTISGDAIDRMTQDELNSRVKDLRVFARVSPENKVSIVKAFRSSGNIVSMTGDGVNDAPSLKSADIGLAMGITGTDVAKGAADMILTDDNFATIRLAIQEGRNIYNNIRKAVLYLLASNAGEVLVMFAAILAGWPAPLGPVQILWVNLVTDSFPALALGVDPGNPGIMREKPREPKESLFARGGIANLILYGLIIGGSTLFAFKLGYHEGYMEGLALGGIRQALSEGLREGRTFALTVLSVSQLFHAIGMRNTNQSIFRMNHLNNKFILGSIAAGLVLQVCIVQIPALSRIFSTKPLSAGQWMTTFLLSVLPLVAHEIVVLIKKLRRKSSGNIGRD